MARREVAARYAGTAAGVAWAYAQPLLTIRGLTKHFPLKNGATVRAVGFEADPGEFSAVLDSNGAGLVSTGADFTTLGLAPGEWREQAGPLPPALTASSAPALDRPGRRSSAPRTFARRPR